MSSGIPVLTNSIGIEGIYARDGLEYFHCEKPEEYIEAIQKLSESSEENLKMGLKAKQYIKENYDYGRDAEIFREKIINLCQS